MHTCCSKHDAYTINCTTSLMPAWCQGFWLEMKNTSGWTEMIVDYSCWRSLNYLSIGTSNESIPQTATQPAISPPPKPTISRIVPSAYLLNPSPRSSGNVATKMPSPVAAVKRTCSPHKEESPKKIKIEEVFEILRSYHSNVQNFEYSFHPECWFSYSKFQIFPILIALLLDVFSLPGC